MNISTEIMHIETFQSDMALDILQKGSSYYCYTQPVVTGTDEFVDGFNAPIVTRLNTNMAAAFFNRSDLIVDTAQLTTPVFHQTQELQVKSMLLCFVWWRLHMVQWQSIVAAFGVQAACSSLEFCRSSHCMHWALGTLPQKVLGLGGEDSAQQSSRNIRFPLLSEQKITGITICLTTTWHDNVASAGCRCYSCGNWLILSLLSCGQEDVQCQHGNFLKHDGCVQWGAQAKGRTGIRSPEALCGFLKVTDANPTGRFSTSFVVEHWPNECHRHDVVSCPFDRSEVCTCAVAVAQHRNNIRIVALGRLLCFTHTVNSVLANECGKSQKNQTVWE